VIGNSRAIEAAGIGRGREDPEGGVIDRGPDGAPAGPFRESAAALVDAMPAPTSITRSGARRPSSVADSGITRRDHPPDRPRGPVGAAGALEVAECSPRDSDSTHAPLIGADVENRRRLRRSRP
jgi:predicted amidohydrolase YtcJ